MIAGDKNDSRSLAGFSKSFCSTSLCDCSQSGSTLQAPEIDDIADEIDGVRLVVAKKIEEGIGLAGPCAQMNIGEKKGPVLARLAGPVPILNAVLGIASIPLCRLPMTGFCS